MKKFKYAVTHPGQAHRDDTLAAAILLGSGMVRTIYRREPTGEELEDPSVLVFDVGGEYFPQRNNYDHHQLQSIPCALHLIAEHVLGWKNPEMVFPWWNAVDVQDRFGPRAMLQHFGANPDLVGIFKDPLGAAIVRIFGQTAKAKVMLTAGATDPFIEILLEIGANLVSIYNKFWLDWNKLEDEYINYEVGMERILISTEPGNSALLARAEKENIRIVQQPNQRGEGVTLTRVNDAQGVDFNRVNKSLISFVHNTGFMCVVDNEKDVPEVIRQAITK